MVSGKTLHMNIGDGESSYAKNSSLQETAIRKSLPILKHTINGIANSDIIQSRCFKIADLGCSSSKNTLLLASNIINMVDEACKENSRKTPQFQVWLNDLFENDFNSIFKLLPKFYAKLVEEKGESFGSCFVSAIPGSFYGRLFPDQSLHFVHSSYGIHWLSQIPEGLENNTSNIYMAKTSPPNVCQAYRKQFHTDFTKFLRMRSEEIVHGGCMVLTFLGRSMVDPTSDDGCSHWQLLAQSLLDMVKDGLVRESDINSFNLPIYYPCEDEVRNFVKNEGSFFLKKLTVFQLNWDPHDTDYTNTNDSVDLAQKHGKNAAKVVRAVTEPLLASHFRDTMMDMLFKKYEKHLAQHLAIKKTRYFNVVVSLIKN